MNARPADNDAGCTDCGHAHTPHGCTGEPTPSDLWAGVSVATCDCIPVEELTYGPTERIEEEHDCDGSDEHPLPCWPKCVIPPASTGGAS